MPTQTMAGGDVAEIDGAPPVDAEAIPETDLLAFSTSCIEAPRENKVKVLRNEVEKSLAGQIFSSSKTKLESCPAVTSLAEIKDKSVLYKPSNTPHPVSAFAQLPIDIDIAIDGTPSTNHRLPTHRLYQLLNILFDHTYPPQTDNPSQHRFATNSVT